MRGFVFVILFLVPSVGSGQWDVRTVAYAGLEGVCDTIPIVLSGNPASAALKSSTSARLSVVPAPFGLSDLRHAGLTGSMSSRGWGIAFHAATYGRELFRSDAIQLDVAASIADRSAVGLSISPRIWQVKGYPPLLEWNVGVGFIVMAGSTIIGSTVMVADPAKDDMRGRVVVGAAVQAAPGFWLRGELEQEVEQFLATGYSLSYRVLSFLEIRVGWRDSPHIAAMGITLAADPVDVEFGSNWHTVLGWTSAVGLGMAF